MWRYLKWLCSHAVLASAVACPIAGTAATFTVDTTLDVVDTALGDGDCFNAAVAACSLRAAIQEANELAGPDAIRLPAGVYLITRPGEEKHGVDHVGDRGDLDIRGSLEIRGENVAVTIIDGNYLDRVIDIYQGSVDISHVTITRGATTEVGGGIRANGGLLSLRHARIVENRAGSGGGIGDDNGTWGNYMLEDVLIEGNRAGDDKCESGTAFGAVGGGVALFPNPREVFSIVDSVVRGNVSCESGGGIDFTYDVTIDDSIISENRALAGGGGGIFLWAVGGSTRIARSTIENNEAATAGGIYIGGAGEPIIENTTISGNRARYGATGLASKGTIILHHVTLARNTYVSPNARATGWIHDPEWADWPASPIVRNSVIAENAGRNCRTVTESGAPWPHGISSYSNLDDDGSCELDDLGVPASISGVSALLENLADNGGLGRTHALQPGSPAIDAAHPRFCLPTDQRGVPRGVKCDIGAFEVAGDPTFKGPFTFWCSDRSAPLAIPACLDFSWTKIEFSHPRSVDSIFDCMADGPGCMEFGAIDWPRIYDSFELQIFPEKDLEVALYDTQGKLIAAAIPADKGALLLKIDTLPEGRYLIGLKGAPTTYRMSFPTLGANKQETR